MIEREKKKKTLRNLQDNIKSLTFTTLESQKKRRKRLMQKENVFEYIMAENFPNLMKYINLQIQEAQMNPKPDKEKKILNTT